MGLAASQARLLFITNRQNDVSAKLQRLSNTNMILARDEEDVSTKYHRMLSEKTMKLKDGVDLSYDALMGATGASLGYTSARIVTDANNRVVLNNTLASAYGLSVNGGKPHDIKEIYKTDEDFVSKVAGADVAAELDSVKKNGDKSSVVLSDADKEILKEFKSSYGTYPSIKTKMTPDELVKKMGSFSFGSSIKNNIGYSSSNQDSSTFNENTIDSIYDHRSDFKSSGNTTAKALANMSFNSILNSSDDITVVIADDGDAKDDTGNNIKDVTKSNFTFLTNTILKSLATALGLNYDDLKAYVDTSFTNKVTSNIDSGNYNDSRAHIGKHGNGGNYSGGRKNCLDGNLISKATSTGGKNIDSMVLNVTELLKQLIALVSNKYAGANISVTGDLKNTTKTNLGNDYYTFVRNNKGYGIDEYTEKLQAYTGFQDAKLTSALNYLGKADSTSQDASNATKAAYYKSIYDALDNNGWVVDPDESSLQAKLENGTYKLSGQNLKNNTDLYTEDNKYSEKEAEAYYDQEMAKIHRKEKQMDIDQQKLQTEYNSLTNDLNSVKSILEANVQRSFTYCQQG